jgi:hypothetical protein
MIKYFILGIICRFATQILWAVLRRAHRWSLLSARHTLMSVVILPFLYAQALQLASSFRVF